VTVCAGMIAEWVQAFWVLALVFAAPAGINLSWANVLAINLGGHGFDSDAASWIGCWSTVAGAVASVLAGLIADRLGSRWFRLLVGVLYTLAALSFTWFAAACAGLLPSQLESTWVMVAAVVSGSGSLLAATPLLYELLVEESYPLSEAAAVGAAVEVSNLFQVAFLLVPVDSMGSSWQNWALALVFPPCVVLLAFGAKPLHRRTVADQRHYDAIQ
jgi:MFS family permease